MSFQGLAGLVSPSDVTSFNSLTPNTPTHLCRMGSGFHILQGFFFSLHILQKKIKLKPEPLVHGQLGFPGVPTYLQDHGPA